MDGWSGAGYDDWDEEARRERVEATRRAQAVREAQAAAVAAVSPWDGSVATGDGSDGVGAPAPPAPAWPATGSGTLPIDSGTGDADRGLGGLGYPAYGAPASQGPPQTMPVPGVSGSTSGGNAFAAAAQGVRATGGTPSAQPEQDWTAFYQAVASPAPLREILEASRQRTEGLRQLMEAAAAGAQRVREAHGRLLRGAADAGAAIRYGWDAGTGGLVPQVPAVDPAVLRRATFGDDTIGAPDVWPEGASPQPFPPAPEQQYPLLPDQTGRRSGGWDEYARRRVTEGGVDAPLSSAYLDSTLTGSLAEGMRKSAPESAAMIRSEIQGLPVPDFVKSGLRAATNRGEQLVLDMAGAQEAVERHGAAGLPAVAAQTGLAFPAAVQAASSALSGAAAKALLGNEDDVLEWARNLGVRGDTPLLGGLLNPVELGSALGAPQTLVDDAVGQLFRLGAAGVKVTPHLIQVVALGYGIDAGHLLDRVLVEAQRAARPLTGAAERAAAGGGRAVADALEGAGGAVDAATRYGEAALREARSGADPVLGAIYGRGLAPTPEEARIVSVSTVPLGREVFEQLQTPRPQWEEPEHVAIHQEILRDALGYDPQTRTVAPLVDEGVPHIVQPVAEGGYEGQVEHNYRVLLPQSNLVTLRYAAAKLGRLTFQDGAGVIWRTEPGSGQALFYLDHPGGGRWTDAEFARLPWARALRGQADVSTDGGALVFPNFTGDERAFRDYLAKLLERAGVPEDVAARYGTFARDLDSEFVGYNGYGRVLAGYPAVLPSSATRSSHLQDGGDDYLQSALRVYRAHGLRLGPHRDERAFLQAWDRLTGVVPPPRGGSGGRAGIAAGLEGAPIVGDEWSVRAVLRDPAMMEALLRATAGNPTAPEARWGRAGMLAGGLGGAAQVDEDDTPREAAGKVLTGMVLGASGGRSGARGYALLRAAHQAGGRPAARSRTPRRQGRSREPRCACGAGRGMKVGAERALAAAGEFHEFLGIGVRTLDLDEKTC